MIIIILNNSSCFFWSLLDPFQILCKDEGKNSRLLFSCLSWSRVKLLLKLHPDVVFWSCILKTETREENQRGFPVIVKIRCKISRKKQHNIKIAFCLLFSNGLSFSKWKVFDEERLLSPVSHSGGIRSVSSFSAVCRSVSSFSAVCRSVTIFSSLNLSWNIRSLHTLLTKGERGVLPVKLPVNYWPAITCSFCFVVLKMMMMHIKEEIHLKQCQDE